MALYTVSRVFFCDSWPCAQVGVRLLLESYFQLADDLANLIGVRWQDDMIALLYHDLRYIIKLNDICSAAVSSFRYVGMLQVWEG